MSDKLNALHKKLKNDAEKSGYILNPEDDFTAALAEGLVKNTDRYGYQACPCRLASGERAKDLDIICPCDYRDDDLTDYGACYCGLYVSRAVADGEKKLKSIPERRKQESPHYISESSQTFKDLPFPVWRCNVCGYLCARTEPPAVCPICKADKDRFTRFT